ncbi:hypothetical protein QQS21_006424 [Conoideocrella luteorostrata]|uniref:Zn(2)-C6 fungal-type domain-containing protein n=1 Tax=Conoideocrella luteorostrata TaxID=1105319 RepID=A0AAJ0CQC9_9HYPO|nr:hypothetical protein QQS21_006424 [Conoideocrella luteorostrata]
MADKSLSYSSGGTMAHLVSIAPATAGRTPNAQSNNTSTPDSATTRFNCQSCVRKKVKCDRALPICSGCRKGRLECLYQAPLPRKRKKKCIEDLHERLARYEHILRSNGLLSTARELSPPGNGAEIQNDTKDSTPSSTLYGPTKAGKLVSGDGKSRYIDNILLLPAGEGDLCELSESDQDVDNIAHETPPKEQSTSSALGLLVGGAVNLTMLGSHQNLTDVHPSHDEASKLWATYIENVEPLCKVLHMPTIVHMVDKVSKQPPKAAKGDECLLFSIYYFAVFSMSDADCLRMLQNSRRKLMAKYSGAFLQALVNVSWLKTTSMRVLQAYVLFLIAVRSQIDPDTFWSLTGIAIRLAQRMGLHHDGENLGLPPFEVQMRRRVFWQLLPLDSYAGQVSGTGIMISPDSWDTKPPLNINDDQIYPGMTEEPCEKNGATEMIFCLTKIELSTFYNRTGVKLKGASASFKNTEEIDKMIDEVEGRIEANYLRYCDILNPLHLFTLGVVRSAANVVRLRNRMPPLMEHRIDDYNRKDLCALAKKILDTDNTIYRNPSLRKFQWSIRSFFLWDALLCVLFSLSKVGFYAGADLEAAWNMVAEVFSNHEELVERRRALHAVICDVTLKAWFNSPPRQLAPEPSFITAIRNRRMPKVTAQQEALNEMGSSEDVTERMLPIDEPFSNMDESSLTMDINFGLNPSEWMFWDQLYRDVNDGD